MLEKMAVILIASFKYPMCQLEVRNVGYNPPIAKFALDYLCRFIECHRKAIANLVIDSAHSGDGGCDSSGDGGDLSGFYQRRKPASAQS